MITIRPYNSSVQLHIYISVAAAVVCSSTGFSCSYSDRRNEQAGPEVALYSCIREMLHSNLGHPD
jgi:hypothetical protein